LPDDKVIPTIKDKIKGADTEVEFAKKLMQKRNSFTVTPIVI